MTALVLRLLDGALAPAKKEQFAVKGLERSTPLAVAMRSSPYSCGHSPLQKLSILEDSVVVQSQAGESRRS